MATGARGGEQGVERADDSGRPVYGVVVTARGDPVPMASLRWRGERVGRTNTYGEFAVFVPREESGELAISHPEFAAAVERVGAGDDPLERLVVLPYRPPVADDDALVFLIDEPAARGLPDARVRLVDLETRALLHESRTRYDGSVVWPGKRAWSGRVEVHVRRDDWPRDDVEVWDIGHDAWISANRTLPREPERELVVDTPAAYGGPVSISLHTERGYTVFDARVAERIAFAYPGGYGPLWALVQGELRAFLRPLVPTAGSDVLVARATDGVARFVFERGDDAARATYPHLHATVGRPWIVPGPSFGETRGSSQHAPATVRLTASGTDLVSPLLDLGACSLSLRLGKGEDDSRVFAPLPDAERRAALGPGEHTFTVPMHVVRGTGAVRARFVSDADASMPCDVVLSRRGGGYVAARRLRPGDSVEWSGLSAGVFVARRTERSAPAREGVAIDAIVDVQQVLVRPGQVTDIRVHAPRPDSPPRGRLLIEEGE